MADNIGQIIGEEPMVPNSPMMPVGQALTQGQPQQPALQPTPEMLKDPKFHAIGEWIRRPENMLTALVLAGSLMQDRRPGQSKMDAVAERGLGTLGFRGEMRRLNQKDTDEAEKAKSEADYKKGQIDVATDRNRIERQGIEATSQDNLNRVTAQTGIAGMNDATARYLADLENKNRLEAARISAAGGADTEENSFMTAKDIIDIQKFAAENQIPFDQAMIQFARVRIMTDPRYAGMIQITEGPPPKPAGKATPEKGKKTERTPPKSYKSVPQSAPASGLPNPLLGQSVGRGSHEAPPTNAPYDPKYLYPGK